MVPYVILYFNKVFKKQKIPVNISLPKKKKNPNQATSNIFTFEEETGRAMNLLGFVLRLLIYHFLNFSGV